MSQDSITGGGAGVKRPDSRGQACRFYELERRTLRVCGGDGHYLCAGCSNFSPEEHAKLDNRRPWTLVALENRAVK
jgi:hypothetical protein